MKTSLLVRFLSSESGSGRGGFRNEEGDLDVLGKVLGKQVQTGGLVYKDLSSNPFNDLITCLVTGSTTIDFIFKRNQEKQTKSQ